MVEQFRPLQVANGSGHVGAAARLGMDEHAADIHALFSIEMALAGQAPTHAPQPLHASMQISG